MGEAHGFTRDFLERLGVPHGGHSHAVIVVEAAGQFAVLSCCDEEGKAVGLLRDGARAAEWAAAHGLHLEDNTANDHA